MKIFALVSLCGLAHGAVVPDPAPSLATAVTRETTAAPVTLAPSLPTKARPILPIQLTTTNAEAFGNFRKFNDLTRPLWDRSKFEKIVIKYGKNLTDHDKVFRDHKSLASKIKDKSLLEGGLEKRQSWPAYGNWVSQGFASNWNWFNYWFQATCKEGGGWDYYGGLIMKIVAVENQYRTDYKFWVNMTENWYPPVLSPSRPYTYPLKCSISSGWRQQTQCVNKIWKTNTATWETYNPSAHANYGWTTGNSSYNGHTVRTIYDCLLDRVAVEYKTVVQAIGTRPVTYYIDGLKYYRWYDSVNFAWFAACPSYWQRKIMKRQGLGRNSNPVWDFGSHHNRDPRADLTWYPQNLIPNFDYSNRTNYSAMYWPPWNYQYITIDGQVCQHMAVSRPGLRHWTARLVEIPTQGYPQATKEVRYPTGWQGPAPYNWENWSYSGNWFQGYSPWSQWYL